MKQMLFTCAIALACSLIACNEKETTLAGDWDNKYINIKTNSKNNTDSSETLEISGADWQTKLKANRIRTSLRPDSTWNSAHYNLNDSIVYDPSGKWWVVGDSLVFQQILPTPETNTFKFILNGDSITFEAMLDWDLDGKKDDHYFGRQVRVKKY
ncbi:MAG TPA: hypothetical protein VHM26_17265 [Chitinophagaceae bacterium]|jgi:hypothetical protein|nr:hypothetical protein [Chitinophagaceae bacterium]